MVLPTPAPSASSPLLPAQIESGISPCEFTRDTSTGTRALSIQSSQGDFVRWLRSLSRAHAVVELQRIKLRDSSSDYTAGTLLETTRHLNLDVGKKGNLRNPLKTASEIREAIILTTHGPPDEGDSPWPASSNSDSHNTAQEDLPSVDSVSDLAIAEEIAQTTFLVPESSLLAVEEDNTSNSNYLRSTILDLLDTGGQVAPSLLQYLDMIISYMVSERLMCRPMDVVRELTRWKGSTDNLSKALEIQESIAAGLANEGDLRRLARLAPTLPPVPCAYIGIVLASPEACSAACRLVVDMIAEIEDEQLHGAHQQKAQSLPLWREVEALLTDGLVKGLCAGYGGMSRDVLARHRTDAQCKFLVGKLQKVLHVLGLRGNDVQVQPGGVSEPWVALRKSQACFIRWPFIALCTLEESFDNGAVPVTFSRGAAFQEALACLWSGAALNVARAGAPVRHHPGQVLRNALSHLHTVPSPTRHLVFVLTSPPENVVNFPELRDHAQGMIYHDVLGSLLSSERDGFTAVHIQHLDIDPTPGSNKKEGVTPERCQALDIALENLGHGDDLVVVLCGLTPLSLLDRNRLDDGSSSLWSQIVPLGRQMYSVQVGTIGNGRERVFVSAPEASSMRYTASRIRSADAFCTAMATALTLANLKSDAGSAQNRIAALRASTLGWLVDRLDLQGKITQAADRVRRGALNAAIHSLPATIVLNPGRTRINVCSDGSPMGSVEVQLHGNITGSADGRKRWCGRVTAQMIASATGHGVVFRVLDASGVHARDPGNEADVAEVNRMQQPGAFLQQALGLSEFAWADDEVWQSLVNRGGQQTTSIYERHAGLVRAHHDAVTKMIESRAALGALRSKKVIASVKVEVDATVRASAEALTGFGTAFINSDSV